VSTGKSLGIATAEIFESKVTWKETLKETEESVEDMGFGENEASKNFWRGSSWRGSEQSHISN